MAEVTTTVSNAIDNISTEIEAIAGMNEITFTSTGSVVGTLAATDTISSEISTFTLADIDTAAIDNAVNIYLMNNPIPTGINIQDSNTPEGYGSNRHG